MAKTSRRPSASPATKNAKAPAANSSAPKVENALKALDELKTDYEKNRQQLMGDVLEQKKGHVATAKKAVQQAQKDLAKREKELHDLKVQAGLASPRKARLTSGSRKPRTSKDDKAQFLESYLKGQNGAKEISYKQVRKDLLASGKFSTADLNSSQKFGEQYLPKSWKLEGTRSSAKLTKA